MRHHQYLMIPGPTPVPQTVALAGAVPMINHRGPEFGELLKETTRGLQEILKTRNTVLTFPAAGTGAMEAAAANLTTPGERVLVGVAGEFGARFAEILRVGGADVAIVKSEPGHPVSPEAIRDALRKNQSITTVVVTHNETSKGRGAHHQLLQGQGGGRIRARRGPQVGEGGRSGARRAGI